jgi:hypothetical protein
MHAKLHAVGTKKYIVPLLLLLLLLQQCSRNTLPVPSNGSITCTHREQQQETAHGCCPCSISSNINLDEAYT